LHSAKCTLQPMFIREGSGFLHRKGFFSSRTPVKILIAVG
jgi:hypothetical protein